MAAHSLRDDADLTAEEHLALRSALLWFNESLNIPDILEKRENRRAISWFKPDASEAIQRMWQLKTLLDDHGVHVQVLRTSDPGIVVYEDPWQVVAKPHKGQRF